jgi:hypothetical protein
MSSENHLFTWSKVGSDDSTDQVTGCFANKSTAIAETGSDQL